MTPLKLQTTLVAYRKQQHLTQTEVADKLFISRQTISNWENGRTYPDIQSLILLASLYHVTVNDLVKADLIIMQTQTEKHHLKLLITGILITLILIYALFISLRWLPMIPTVMAIATVTTIGLILTGYFIHLSNQLHLKTFRQINAYLKHQPAPNQQQRHQWLGWLFGAVLGILIGGGLTWWIATTILHWSF